MIPEPAGSNSPPPAAAPGARSVAITAALVAALSAAVPLAFEASHRASRPTARQAPGGIGEVVLARTDADVIAAWRRRGLRGRTLVHAGRYLHFVDREGKRSAQRLLVAPGTGATLDRHLEDSASPENYLWVASSLDVARRIFYVSPPAALAGRLSALGLSDGALPLRIDAEATPRTLDRAPPRLEEPVLLDVNASWFDEADGTGLLAALREALPSIELATVSLAEDAADVSPAAREAARAFAATLSTSPGRSAP